MQNIILKCTQLKAKNLWYYIDNLGNQSKNRQYWEAPEVSNELQIMQEI